jgi:hypothetical protein
VVYSFCCRPCKVFLESGISLNFSTADVSTDV